MKKILLILAIVALFVPAFAQTFNSKAIPANPIQPTGPYGHQAFNYITGTNCTIVSGVVTPVSSSHPDTLVVPVTSSTGYGTDSGYVQWSMFGNYNRIFDMAITKVSGTLAGAAVLYGSFDNATWFAITGSTTYCAGCIGASATITNTAGTKHYQWQIPDDAPNYPYWQVAPILSGTCSATFSGKVGYQN